MKRDLRTKIFVSYFVIIVIFGLLIFIVGARLIQNDIIARAQQQVKNDLRVAHSMFMGESERVKTAFTIVPLTVNLSEVKQKLGLDYIYMVDIKDRGSVRSEIVQRAFSGEPTGGIRIIEKDELQVMSPEIARRCEIEIKPTRNSQEIPQKSLQQAMAIGYAMPVFDEHNNVKSVIYGGKLLNRNFELVDKIRDLVFGNTLYDKKPLGTVTIFLGDIRIATNVLDSQGERAIGTVVSDTVQKKVLTEGRSWLDRAFVVTDWYLTAYEPLKNIRGETIGILYVGVLEQPFKDLEKRVLLTFLGILFLVAVAAMVFSYVLSDTVSRPVRLMLAAIHRITHGDLTSSVEADSDIGELQQLGQSFNEMTAKLAAREESLRVSNEKLAALNKSYLDLISFVAHELKGILSSTILNAYALRDGFLGLVNFKQRKALDSVTRNLDYLEATVKNFLNLSRIEKNELAPCKSDVLLKEDVFDPAVETFSKLANERRIEIINSIEPKLHCAADTSLLQIVAHNLLGNALKYGTEGGKILLSSKNENGKVQVEVYNDGRPLLLEEIPKLFRRFSRLDASGAKKTQGTGLGLFITKEIVEKHHGRIWAEAKAEGNAFIFQIPRG